MKFISEIQDFYQTQDRYVFWPLAVSVLFTCTIIFLWALNLNKLPQELPLFYSLPWGESQLGSIYQFLVLPAVLLITILLNLIITTQLQDSQLLIKRVLSIVSLIIALLISITAFKIIFIFI